MEKVWTTGFGMTPDERRRMRAAITALIKADTEDFSVLDDRGGSNSWLITIEEPTWNRLPTRTKTRFKTRYGFASRDAAGSLYI